MTDTSWNTSGNEPASDEVRRVSSLMLLTLLWLVLWTPVWAADHSTGPFLFTSSATRTDRDIEIEIKVRRTLREDAPLKELNLGVRMVGGVAKLSGPVPSQELKQRVIRIVERVEGVLKVSAGDLYVSSASHGPKPMIVVLENEQPTQTRSASPRMPSSVGAPTPTGGEGVPPLVGQQVTLLAPEASPRPARVPKSARLTAQPRAASPRVSISPAVEALRRRDRRFQSIRTRVQGSTVYIFPSDDPSEDPMMFAQAIRRLPGVQHVIVASGPR
ncbi:MAG TPA: BON domain-containing protein [Gemmataceae bacterium]|nr:BON domain-containing protein [Gemmataceae bacterium]